MADTWELINHPLTDETGLVLAAQMKRQNDILQALPLVLPVRNSWMQHSAVCWMAKIPQKSSGAGGRCLPVMA